MKFTHEGSGYRIRFRHDKPRDLASHEGHSVEIGRDTLERISVLCLDCGIVLLPVGKKQRQRLTHCVLQKYIGKLSGFQWKDVAHGVGRVNEKEGDHFCKKAGRAAAFDNMMLDESLCCSGLGSAALKHISLGSYL